MTDLPRLTAPIPAAALIVRYELRLDQLLGGLRHKPFHTELRVVRIVDFYRSTP